MNRAAWIRYRRALLGWGRRNLRSFFWREESLEPFEVLVLEVLLARTRAAAVERVGPTLLETYPDPSAMAGARRVTLEQLLMPLGLQQKRSNGLRALAGAILERDGGRVLRSEARLLALPSVGRYAANATLCVAFGRRVPIVDANVARVFGRFFGLRAPAPRLASDEPLWALAAAALPARDVRLYNWSLLDLGALVCRPRNPRCDACPLSTSCRHAAR